MEEIRLKQATATIKSVFGRITDIFRLTNPSIGTATHDMLDDSEGVEKYAEGVLAANQFTRPELTMLVGVAARFSRHLSEVEQTVYEEIGDEKFDRIRLIQDTKSDAYNLIYYYLKGNETK